jgi:hypothetical protein
MLLGRLACFERITAPPVELNSTLSETEQFWHNQKYSTRPHCRASAANSLPSLSLRKDAKQAGFAHLESTAAAHAGWQGATCPMPTISTLQYEPSSDSYRDATHDVQLSESQSRTAVKNQACCDCHHEER